MVCLQLCVRWSASAASAANGSPVRALAEPTMARHYGCMVTRVSEQMVVSILSPT